MPEPVVPSGSPVNEDSLIIPDSGTDLCGAVLGMIQSIAVFRSDLDYRVDEDNGNLPTTEFANQIGAMIFPPGTIMAFKIVAVNASADNVLLKQEVEKLWKKPDGTEAAQAPWWVLCDGDLATGAPDLIDRFIIGAGTKGTGADAILRPAGEIGGSNTITIGVENLPNHDHMLGALGDAGNPGLGHSNTAFEAMTPVPLSAPATWEATFSSELGSGTRTCTITNYTCKTGPVHESVPAPTIPDGGTPVAGSGAEVNSRPAYVALVYAMRTTRMF